MAQLEDRIPVDVSPGVAGGPEFRTTIKTLRGGGESRNQLWANPRRRYTTSYGNRDPQVIADELLTFLYKTRGSLHSFRAKDWSDYQVTGEVIATADGSDYWFRLTKAYSDYSRRILKPVAGSVSVTVDGVSIPASDYRIDTVNGVVVLFETPGVDEVVTWTGEFDVPVRFAEDAMDVVMDVHTSGHVESVGLIEVRARENIVEADYAVAQAAMPYSLSGELGMPSGVDNYVIADFKRGRYFKDGVADTFAGLLTFARASSATYVDASGVLQTATTDAPRFTYDPLAGEKLGLMREAAATNLILRSEEFGTSPWTTFGASVSANAATAPDGNATADKVVESVGGTNHQVAQLVTLAAATEYATSVWVKAAGRDYVAFAVTSPGMAQRDLTVSLTTGAVTDDDLGGSSSVEGFASGWYRIKFTYTTVTGGSTTIRIRPSDGPLQADQTYSGDGTSGVYVWGAQCEAGNFPSSYIATAGATATRAAEAIRIPASNLPTPAAGSAWVVQMDGVMSFADNNADAVVRHWLRIAAGNIFYSDIDTAGGLVGSFQVSATAAGGTTTRSADVFTPGVNVPFNVAGLYSADRTQGAYGGNLLTALSHSNGIPTFTTEPLLIMPNGNAIIERLMIGSFPTTVATDSYLQGITA